ncbi:MAG: hypothetical protein DCC68_21340 [Planctomycetota bacterium]|nr:MAG: hypothetical protein DCC68_21340 [Planctomycetota bacterium]
MVISFLPLNGGLRVVAIADAMNAALTLGTRRRHSLPVARGSTYSTGIVHRARQTTQDRRNRADADNETAQARRHELAAS